MSPPTPFEALAGAVSAADFMRELCVYWLEKYQAHGAAAWLRTENNAQGKLHLAAQVGRGLALCDEQHLVAAMQGGQIRAAGELLSLPLGTLGAVQLVGAGREDTREASAYLPLLTLALEGVQAREARFGRGRVAETLAQLATRIGGSLDMAEVLTATAQSAAQSLGFERALVGLFEAPPTDGLATDRLSTDTEHIYRTQAVYMHGFAADFTGTVDVGPASFATLMEHGEVIAYDHERDAHTPLGAGLKEFAPQVAFIAPLKARGQPLGILYTDSTQPKKPTERDDALLLALAEHASLAIDNARLYAAETRKRQVAEALREAGVTLAQSLNLGHVLQRTLSAAQALFGADACAMHELQVGGRSLSIRSAAGLSTEFVLGSRSKVGAGVTGQAVATRQSVAVYDNLAAQISHTQTSHTPTQQRQSGGSRYTRRLLAEGRYPFRGLLSVPLLVRGRILGALTLYYAAPLPLGREDCDLAQVFAAQAALALENARLYEEEVERERESALLLEMASLLTTKDKAERESQLKEMTKLLTRALGAERGLLALPNLGAGPGSAEQWQVYPYQMPAPSGAEVQRLFAQVGRGPRPLSRRSLLASAPDTELLDTDLLDTGTLNQPQSGLLAPLRLGDELLGYYYADQSTPERPAEKWLSLCRAALGQLSQALGREQLLQALEREEARYRLLAHSAHDLIMVLDAQMVVSYANPATQRLLGPLEGYALTPLLGADSLLAFDLACQASLLSPLTGGRCELKLRGPERDLVLEVRVSAIQAGTDLQGLLVVARDLSELQTLAQEISRRSQELADVSQRSGQLRDYLALFTQAQEEERRRISRELHDDTAQVLVAIGQRLDRLGRDLGKKGANPQTHSNLQPELERVADIRQDLNAAIESVRRFARNLRPSVLDDLGLLSALEWLTGQATTPTRLEVQGHERRLGGGAELTIFRAVQEALGNVDKHAQASSAAVRVVYTPTSVTVSILDDGRGLDAGLALQRAREGHLGLVGLRERVGLSGGTLEVLSEAGQGTEVRFILPL